MRIQAAFTTLASLAFVSFALAAPKPAAKPKPVIEPYHAIAIECEDMQGVGGKSGWKFAKWGLDLYQQNTFGGHWSSRLANAMADESEPKDKSGVYHDISIPEAAKYKIWAKYECPPFFNYSFGIRIEKLANGKTDGVVFEKTYGLRDGVKHYSFTSKTQTGDLYWTWGMDHDAAEGFETELAAGNYRVTLFKAPNVDRTGARSVDAILITSRITDLSSPDFPRFPMLDELQKLNHCYFRFTNTGKQPILLSYNHWAHRANWYYAMMPPAAVRFYDESGKLLMAPADPKQPDAPAAPLSFTDGQWKTVLAPGEMSPWIDLGPTMTTENSTPFWAKGKVVDDKGVALKEQPDEIPLRVDIAMEPSAKSILKTFNKPTGSEELTVLVQPDLHRKEGVELTALMTDVFRNMSKQLDALPRVGPLPKKIRMMAYTGAPTQAAKPNTPPFKDMMDYHLALGLNTFSFLPGQSESWDAALAYYKSKSQPVVEPSARFHHTQEMDALKKQVFVTEPGAKEASTMPIRGAMERFYYVSYGDEIGLPSINPKDPALIESFRAFLKSRKVNPADLGLASLDEAQPLPSYTAAAAALVGVAPTKDEKGQPALPTGPESAKVKALYWWTHEFIIDRGVNDFAQKTIAMTALIGPHFKTSANLGGMHPFYWMHQASFIESFRGKAMTLAWSEDYDYCQPEGSRLVIEFDGAYLRAGAKYHDTPMQFYIMPHYPGNSGRHLIQNVVSLWGQNIKDVDWFDAGPDTFHTENFINYRGGIETGRAMRLASGMAGNIEDALLPARTRKAKVAILLSESSDIWDVDGTSQNAIAPGTTITNAFQEERKAIWYVLRKAGYLVDLLTENDVAEGRLEGYRALYVCGQNLDRRCVEPVKKWVNAGGALVGTAGAMRKDEYDQPLTALDEVLGRETSIVSRDFFKGPLRVKLELLFTPPIGKVKLESGETFDLFVSREDFKARKDAKIAATFDGAGPAMVMQKNGSGLGCYAGVLAGQTYLKQAYPVRPQGKGGPDNNPVHFEPINVNVQAEKFLLLPLESASIKPDVVTGDRTIVVNLLDGPASTLVTVNRLVNPPDGWKPGNVGGESSVINYVLDTKWPTAKNVKITVPGMNAPSKVRTAMGVKNVKTQATPEGLLITLPELDACDVIVLEK